MENLGFLGVRVDTRKQIKWYIEGEIIKTCHQAYHLYWFWNNSISLCEGTRLNAHLKY